MIGVGSRRGDPLWSPITACFSGDSIVSPQAGASPAATIPQYRGAKRVERTILELRLSYSRGGEILHPPERIQNDILKGIIRARLHRDSTRGNAPLVRRRRMEGDPPYLLTKSCLKMGVFRGLSPLNGGLGVSPRFKFPLPGLGRGSGGWSKSEYLDSLKGG